MPSYANLVLLFPNEQSKTVYSHCSSLPSCILGTWPVVIWGSSHPIVICNINGYQVFTGEANSQMSLSCLAVLWSLWNFGFTTSLRETWTVILQVTSPAPGEFAYKRLKCLCGAQASFASAGLLGSNSCVSHGCRRICV